MHQLRVGRKGDRLRLHRRVDDHTRKVRWPRRAGARRGRQALLDQRRELLLAHALSPARQRRAVEGGLVLKELLAAKQLKIRVLDPALAQRLVRQVMHGLEDRQARHEPRRQWRMPGMIAMTAPNRPSRKRQSMARASFAKGWATSTIWSSRARNRSFCPLSRRSLGRIQSPLRTLTKAKESRLNPQRNLQDNRRPDPQIQQTPKLPNRQRPRKSMSLNDLHGRLWTVPAMQGFLRQSANARLQLFGL